MANKTVNDLNLTQLSSKDVHPQVRENFINLTSWSKSITAAIKGMSGGSSSGGSSSGGSSGGGSSGGYSLTVQYNGTTIGEQAALNFVNNSSIVYSVQNSSVQGRVNVSSTLAPIASLNLLANVEGSASTPVGTSLSALLDAALSNAQGATLYRGAASWAALPPGTNGQVLEAQGSAENPQWAGISALLDIAFGTTQGSTLYRGASEWSALAPGTSGQVLTSGGASANPTWAAGGGGGGGGGGGLEILASASVQGASDTNYSTSSSSFVAVDATDLSVTFTVPPSGSVLVTQNALCTATGSGVHYWGLLNSSGALVGSYSQCVSSPSSPTDNASSGVAQFLVEGLTPGASVTYQWGYKIQAGSSPSALIYHGPNLGFAQMVVCAVNTATPPSVSKSIVVPITGFSNTIPSSSTASIIAYVMNPAGALATGTLTMPASPIDAQIVTIGATQAIVAMTLSANAGQSIENAVTTLNAGPSGAVSYIYDLASTTWYPS